MIDRQLVETMFEAASMQRWNDHIRPHRGFTELDKQAHKIVFAYVIARIEESDRGAVIDWKALIEGGIFEFLHRLRLTDLKPHVFHQLMDRKRDELNRWVLAGLESSAGQIGGGFFERMKAYWFEPETFRLERRILKAAHYLATNWEFEIVYRMNEQLTGIEQTRAAIGNEIEEHYDLAGVQKISLGKKTHQFLDLIGQMRFQQRWAQTPRVPETSVLGHMLLVAVLSYLVSLELGACEKRLYHNFFGGLFHDLPEVLTRDIISPVKGSVEGLDEIIKEIERRELEEKVLPLLPEAWRPEMRYFVADEFASRIRREDGTVQHCSSDEIQASYNEDRYLPIDGEIIRACDKFAAFVEASLSIHYGIKSPPLLDGVRSGYERFASASPAGYAFRALYDALRPEPSQM